MIDTEIVAFRPVPVPFYEDAIECVPAEGQAAFKVVFRPTCQAVGLAYESQLNRLKRTPWATVFMMNMVAEDGKIREMACIDRRTFVMWLATIETSRLKDDETRSKIERYQSEAADILDRWFSGQQTPEPRPSGSPLMQQARMLVALLEQQEAQERQIADTNARVDTVEATANAALAIAGHASDFVTVRGFCSVRRIRLTDVEMKRAGIELRKACLAVGIEPHKIPDSKWGAVNVYPVEIMGRYFSDKRP